MLAAPEIIINFRHYHSSPDQNEFDPSFFLSFNLVAWCSDQGPLMDGHRNANGPFVCGMTVTYWCNSGLYLDGSDHSSCRSNGTWTTVKPSCIIRSMSNYYQHQQGNCSDAKFANFLIKSKIFFRWRMSVKSLFKPIFWVETNFNKRMLVKVLVDCAVFLFHLSCILENMIPS